jgi:hypothetical protein
VTLPGPFGFSASFTREICPTKLDPITAPRNYTTTWVGSKNGTTEAVHQAGAIRKAQGVATGYTWTQAVTVRACPTAIACAFDYLIFGP